VAWIVRSSHHGGTENIVLERYILKSSVSLWCS
jgi:hypothetical protein